MLFNSIDYCIFFILFFTVYWFALGRQLKLQNAFILFASYVFYGWWDYRFLSLIFFTSVTSYFAAIWIENKPQRKKIALTIVLLVNLGILIYFKYAYFLVSSIADFISIWGSSYTVSISQILLPVGISFYTFQALSYVIDVYRGQLKASRDFIECAAFISFFPQLVAGPIERAPHLLPQVQNPRQFDSIQATIGIRMILWGLFKKMMIADNCAQEVEYIFNHYQTVSSMQLWWGAILFGIQIYCDFSAYSEIAIGSGKMLGVEFMQNFKYPYFAKDIKSFWKRWHISLTMWFKDYVFIPLGGSKVSTMITLRNVVIVFALSGLWHGANYTFIIWGLYHALLYVGYTLWIEQSKIHIPSWLGGICTFLLVMIGWVFFRSHDIHQAMDYIKGMFIWSGHWSSEIADVKIIVGLLILLSVECFNRHGLWAINVEEKLVWWQRWLVYFIFIFIILAYGNFNEETFIYFNF